jgi:hypothetical protein
MPAFDDISREIQEANNNTNAVRSKYLKLLSAKTGRNIIIYYSGWLQKGTQSPNYEYSISDTDKTGFMTCIHGMDKKLGLDLILHTPGGSIPATESIVYYLKSEFNNNIRAIVPQIAMSAGTMIALACKEIVMGKQSNLGPIDPQYGLYRAHGIIDEFNHAVQCANSNSPEFYVWQTILQKYDPTLIGECQKTITWSDSLVKEWLVQNMFNGEAQPELMAEKVVADLGSHALTLSHSRHIHADHLKGLGVKIMDMELDQELQDLVLSVHHAAIISMNLSRTYKIIENHNGKLFVQNTVE